MSVSFLVGAAPDRLREPQANDDGALFEPLLECPFEPVLECYPFEPDQIKPGIGPLGGRQLKEPKRPRKVYPRSTLTCPDQGFFERRRGAPPHTRDVRLIPRGPERSAIAPKLPAITQ